MNDKSLLRFFAVFMMGMLVTAPLQLLDAQERQAAVSRYERMVQADHATCIQSGQTDAYCDCVSARTRELGVELSSQNRGRPADPAYSQFHARSQDECARDSSSPSQSEGSIFSPENEGAALAVIAKVALGTCEVEKGPTASSQRTDKQNALDCDCLADGAAQLAWLEKKEVIESWVGSNATPSDLVEYAPYLANDAYRKIVHEFDFRASTGSWIDEGSPQATFADRCIFQNYAYTKTPLEVAESATYASDLLRTRAIVRAICIEGAAKPVPMTHFGQFYDCDTLASIVETSFEENPADSRDTFIFNHVTMNNKNEFSARDAGKIAAGIFTFCMGALYDDQKCNCVAEKGGQEIASDSTITANFLDRRAREATTKFAASCAR